MKFLFRENVFGWNMTGLMGTGGAWFVGYSKKPPLPPHDFEKEVPVDDQREDPQDIKPVNIIDEEDDPVREMVIAAAMQGKGGAVMGEFDGEKLTIKDV